MADYEGMFQDRYTKALSMFADAAAQGKDPREILTQMQTNPTYGQATGRGNLPPPRGAAPNTGQKPIDSDSDSIPRSMLKQYEKYPIDPNTGERRIGPGSLIGSGSLTDEEILTYQGKFPSGSYEDMRLHALRMEGAILGEPIGSGSMTDREFQEYQKDPMTGVSPRARPTGSGSMTDRQIMNFQGDFPSGSYEDMRSKALRSMGYDSMMEFQGDFPDPNTGVLERPFKRHMPLEEFQSDAAAGGGINTLISTPKELLLNLGRKLTGE